MTETQCPQLDPSPISIPPQFGRTYSLIISMEPSVGNALRSRIMSTWSLLPPGPPRLVLQAERCLALTSRLAASSTEVLDNKTLGCVISPLILGPRNLWPII